jgi:type I restriction enzyme, S subunit
MRSIYRRLGEYIKDVKVKNRDLTSELLLGINVNKYFIPSVANIIGTDLSNYKLISKNQFACNRMHVGRDYRIPIALSDKEDAFIVSPAYDVFEIKDTAILLPEYLMMWFSRNEFDRNAWYYTDADVRGGLAWKALCDMQLPIPSIEKQREIVKEYKTIQDRIRLNEKLIQKLEETAQAIYREWFVEFEFPDENGKPYKSSGGEMVWCEELGKEIPLGWEYVTVKDFCTDMKSGGTPSRINPEYWNSNDVPWLKTGEIKNNIILSTEEYISFEGLKNSSAKLLPKDTVLMSMYGVVE